MKSLPHVYHAAAHGDNEGSIALSSPGLETFDTAAPAEFGGPGDLWSPETLLTGSIANCFILTFRAIARASHFEWLRLQAEVEADLTRDEGPISFTKVRVKAKLEVPEGTDMERAKRLLEKSEASCLVTRSLNAETALETEVGVGAG